MTDRKIEILAPAGSYDSFRAALNAGADAVYAGGPRFGARAYADNFTEEELIKAIREAHLAGRRFYLTVNTLLKERERMDLYDYLAPLYENGLDAVIVQDVGVLKFVRNAFPEMDIHASTQMTVTGADGASYLEKAGVCRVVPAREISLKEIARIRRETNLEIECFVHGALCYCYSGQCLMSSIIGGRSGNRGQCAQPCRLPYTIGGKTEHFLSLKDICTLDLIPEMVEAGIDSFKIEGRMKKPEYVAAVTAMYRKYTDLYLEKGRDGFSVSVSDKEKLMDLYNRGGSSDGYYKRQNGKEMISFGKPSHAGVPAARVTAQKGREITASALTDLSKGDVLEITGGKGNYTLGASVKRGGSFSFLVPKGTKFRPGFVFSRIRNNALIDQIDQMWIRAKYQRPVCGQYVFEEGSPAFLTVSCGDVFYTAASGTDVQKAQKRPMTEEQIREKLSKTGESVFFFEKLEGSAGEDVFLPVQEINQLRRTAFDGLQKALEESLCREPGVRPDEEAQGEEATGNGWKGFSVLTETKEQMKAVLDFAETETNALPIRRIYMDCHMTEDLRADEEVKSLVKRAHDSGIECFVALPHILRHMEEARTAAKWEAILSFPSDGVLVRNLEEVSLLKKSGFDKKMILDHNLYVFNRSARSFWKNEGMEVVTAPVELNMRELADQGIRGEEMIVYGHLPVMQSAQCVVNSSSGCTKKSGTTVVTDRYQNKFYAKSFCGSCYNVIYNNLPLCLKSSLDEVLSLEPGMLRLQFSVENREETLGVLRLFGQGEREPEFEYTQGHFRRGIL